MIVVPVTNEYIPNVGAESDSKVTDVRDVLIANASCPMDVTLSGIVMDVSPVQYTNAPCPMDVTLSGIVMDVSPVQL